MTYKIPLRPLLLAALLVVCAVSGSAQAKKKTVKLTDAKGNDVGTATIEFPSTKQPGVIVKLDVKDLPPGVHAVHFHQNPKCDAPDFKSAGGHFNPTNKQHGFDNPQGHHAGDMMNFTVEENGKAKATVKDDEVTMGPPTEWNSLFVNEGTSIIIHAKADDYKTDPSGNSGDRIACGTITQ